MLNPIRTWYADDGDERAEVRADELRDINARVAQLEGQREATERMLFALRKEVAAAKAENALLLERAQVWQPVEDGFAWADDDGDYTSMELSDWRQKIHADYANSRISEIFTLPDNIRLCRLVSQESNQ